MHGRSYWLEPYRQVAQQLALGRRGGSVIGPFEGPHGCLGRRGICWWLHARSANGRVDYALEPRCIDRGFARRSCIVVFRQTILFRCC
jgi:hypothetical protein